MKKMLPLTVSLLLVYVIVLSACTSSIIPVGPPLQNTNLSAVLVGGNTSDFSGASLEQIAPEELVTCDRTESYILSTHTLEELQPEILELLLGSGVLVVYNLDGMDMAPDNELYTFSVHTDIRSNPQPLIPIAQFYGTGPRTAQVFALETWSPADKSTYLLDCLASFSQQIPEHVSILSPDNTFDFAGQHMIYSGYSEITLVLMQEIFISCVTGSWDTYRIYSYIDVIPNEQVRISKISSVITGDAPGVVFSTGQPHTNTSVQLYNVELGQGELGAFSWTRDIIPCDLSFRRVSSASVSWEVEPLHSKYGESISFEPGLQAVIANYDSPAFFFDFTICLDSQINKTYKKELSIVISF